MNWWNIHLIVQKWKHFRVLRKNVSVSVRNNMDSLLIPTRISSEFILFHSFKFSWIFFFVIKTKNKYSVVISFNINCYSRYEGVRAAFSVNLLMDKIEKILPRSLCRFSSEILKTFRYLFTSKINTYFCFISSWNFSYSQEFCRNWFRHFAVMCFKRHRRFSASKCSSLTCLYRIIGK